MRCDPSRPQRLDLHHTRYPIQRISDLWPDQEHGYSVTKKRLKCLLYEVKVAVQEHLTHLTPLVEPKLPHHRPHILPPPVQHHRHPLCRQEREKMILQERLEIQKEQKKQPPVRATASSMVLTPVTALTAFHSTYLDSRNSPGGSLWKKSSVQFPQAMTIVLSYLQKRCVIRVDNKDRAPMHALPRSWKVKVWMG